MKWVFVRTLCGSNHVLVDSQQREVFKCDFLNVPYFFKINSVSQVIFSFLKELIDIRHIKCAKRLGWGAAVPSDLLDFHQFGF